MTSLALEKKNDVVKPYESIEERWEWVLTYMIMEDPFVHEFLMLLDKRSNVAVGTMGVYVEDCKLKLLYNPYFVAKLTTPELVYVLTHEIYHLVFHHCTHRAPENPQDKATHNKAADLAVNSLIVENVKRTMPVNKETGQKIGLLPSNFGFEDKLSLEQYMQLLRDQEDKDGDGKGKGKGKGDAGCSGDDSGDNSFDNHDGWSESDLADELVRQKVDQVSKNERVWGNMSSDLQESILAAQRSQVSWTKYLRHHLGNLISSNYTYTMKRPDRRFGYPYSGKKRACTDRKLVAIDTSLSIGSDDLSQFLTEVNKLSEIQPVDLVLFDTKIQGDVVPFERRRVSYEFLGRGGTDFQEVMDLAEQRKYHSLIILTDGAANAPTKPKFVKDFLWVITGGGNPPVDWGQVVHVVPGG